MNNPKVVTVTIKFCSSHTQSNTVDNEGEIADFEVLEQDIAHSQ